jgi:squalene-hopene/tetraprenyl-beta-curcumene cyclase
MSATRRPMALAAALLAASVSAAVTHAAPEPDPRSFNAKAAAAYLDARAEWWSTWSNAQRDRGTFCMSCHTTLP